MKEFGKWVLVLFLACLPFVSVAPATGTASPVTERESGGTGTASELQLTVQLANRSANLPPLRKGEKGSTATATTTAKKQDTAEQQGQTGVTPDQSDEASASGSRASSTAPSGPASSPPAPAPASTPSETDQSAVTPTPEPVPTPDPASQQATPAPSDTPSKETLDAPNGGKVAYLTFDDGPSIYTEKILDILDAHHVKGTFFMLAPRIEQYQAAVKRMAAEGDTLGLHGVTHDAKQVYRSPHALVAEMNACNEALEKVAGVRTNIIRVPYGSKPWLTQPFRDAVAEAGYHFWDWNVDSYDSRAAKVPVDTIVHEVERQVQPKKTAVILMHDKMTSVEALPRVIRFLKANGFAIGLLSARQEPLNFWNDER